MDQTYADNGGLAFFGYFLPFADAFAGKAAPAQADAQAARKG